ncbi:hypothetical protein T484DRAFT_1647419 [Baffinella frigidus]|nr:hypothetical protein T484DRAFT_1647419 [Cryptophyta sp. CCMP2293]
MRLLRLCPLPRIGVHSPDGRGAIFWCPRRRRAPCKTKWCEGGSRGVKEGCVTNTKPSTFNPQPSTLNPQPSTLNPQPSTLNPKLQTVNPKPQTLNPKPGR